MKRTGLWYNILPLPRISKDVASWEWTWDLSIFIRTQCPLHHRVWERLIVFFMIYTFCGISSVSSETKGQKFQHRLYRAHIKCTNISRIFADVNHFQILMTWITCQMPFSIHYSVFLAWCVLVCFLSSIITLHWCYDTDRPVTPALFCNPAFSQMGRSGPYNHSSVTFRFKKHGPHKKKLGSFCEVGSFT